MTGAGTDAQTLMFLEIFPECRIVFLWNGIIINIGNISKFINQMATMSEKKITIKDIARDCGVGLGTVSRVINSQPGVKDEIRRKVLQYIEDIGWRSNTLSQRLKLASPGRAVIFIASTSMLERKYDQDLFRMVLEQVLAAGFSPLTLFGQCRENLERCLSMKPYAVIVVGTSSFHKEAVAPLIAKGIRVIGLGECDDFAGPIVFPDYRKAAGKATRLLMKAGHRRIGFFGGMGIVKKIASIDAVNIRRIREMMRGIIEVNPAFEPAADALSDCFCDLALLKRALKNGKHSAWLCSDEKMCRQFLCCADSMGINVPDKLAVIGFTQDLPPYAFNIDLSRFYPDNKTQAAQVMELLQGKPVTDNSERCSDCRFHAGATIK